MSMLSKYMFITFYSNIYCPYPLHQNYMEGIVAVENILIPLPAFALLPLEFILYYFKFENGLLLVIIPQFPDIDVGNIQINHVLYE